MAEVSYPSPTHGTPARSVTDPEYDLLASRNTDDGIDGDPTDGDVVVPGTGLQVLVKAGHTGHIRGRAWESGISDVPLTISSNASGSTRYDWVVLRLDKSTWNVRAGIVEGTPGAGTPALTQDSGPTGVWEIVLGQVTIPNGAASVTVIPRTQYVGARIRPANSTMVPFHRELGEIFYHPDTDTLRFWNGATLHTIFEDTGRLTLGPGFDTWTPAHACVGHRIGNVVTLRLWYRRTGSTFSVNDTDGSKLGTVPDTLKSTYNNAFTGTFSQGSTCQVQVRNDGEIWATNLSSSVGVNHTLYVTCTYIREID